MNVTLAFSIDACVTPSRTIAMTVTHCTLTFFIDASGPPSRAITIMGTCCNEGKRDLAVIMVIQRYLSIFIIV